MKKIAVFIASSFVPFVGGLVSSCGISGLFIKNPCDDGGVYYVKQSELVNHELTISQYWTSEKNSNDTNWISYDSANVYLNGNENPIYQWNRKTKLSNIYNGTEDENVKVITNANPTQDFVDEIDRSIDQTLYRCYWFSLNILFNNDLIKANDSKIDIDIFDNNNGKLEKSFTLNYTYISD